MQRELNAADLRGLIEDTVRSAALNHAGSTRYREPVTGYADAADPRWKDLGDGPIPGHLLPTDLLPQARSVVCFFLPFDKGIVAANARAPLCADEWAASYTETNALLSAICEDLQRRLAAVGVGAAFQQPTHNYDPATLRARWSHKSAARIAGVGRFGLNHLLITERGCAGRISSIVVDSAVHDTRSARGEGGGEEPYCGFLAGERCNTCIRLCPASAISGEGLDKSKCNDHCRRVGKYLNTERGFPGTLAICGKCATGPCAFRPFSGRPRSA